MFTIDWNASKRMVHRTTPSCLDIFHTRGKDWKVMSILRKILLWRFRASRNAKVAFFFGTPTKKAAPSLARSTPSEHRPSAGLCKSVAAYNWHWTKKLITKIVHPRPLGPRAPSALSGESRHPRSPFVCPGAPSPPSLRDPPSRASPLFILRADAHLSSRTRSRETLEITHPPPIYNYLLLDYTLLIGRVGERAEKSVSRFLLYAREFLVTWESSCLNGLK